MVTGVLTGAVSVRDLAADPRPDEVGHGDRQPLPRGDHRREAAGVAIDRRRGARRRVDRDPRQRVVDGAPLPLELVGARVLNERPRSRMRYPFSQPYRITSQYRTKFGHSENASRSDETHGTMMVSRNNRHTAAPTARPSRSRTSSTRAVPGSSSSISRKKARLCTGEPRSRMLTANTR